MNTHSILLLCFLSLPARAALPASVQKNDSTLVSSVPQADAEFGSERPIARVAPNVSHDVIWVMPATPEKIFPLLCPVLEYDWIPSWRTKLIHSQSGIAEENCVFETRFAEGPMIWMCTRYEPTTQIEYTCFARRGFIVRLKISLKAVPEGTQMLWSRSSYAYNVEGEAWVKTMERQLLRRNDESPQGRDGALSTHRHAFEERGNALNIIQKSPLGARSLLVLRLGKKISG